MLEICQCRIIRFLQENSKMKVGVVDFYTLLSRALLILKAYQVII